MKATEKVLALLKKRPNKGITPHDFPRAFRLGARVYDLRKSGYVIHTFREYVTATNWIARYVLVGRK